ncbi:MAG: hypothetical protein BRD23_03990 [Halobacteriales archaeon SW_9_67_25]|nr:MAG: hypothetical protein BRD23_03990 [Halobacteriales archaeon SW_9_67_25]
MTVSVLVPSSLCREAEDKREATRKLGSVARAAAVFRVDRLTVFPDPDGEGRWGGGFVETVLRYAATPPYLRKEVWDRRDELEYAGVLPPLRVRSRTGSGSEGSGSSRQGIVTEVGSDGRVRVNCGLQHPVSLPVPSGMEVPDEGEDTALDRDDAGLAIAASRHGESVDVARLGQLVEAVRESGRGADPEMTVAFGAPERGLPEILGSGPAGDRGTVPAAGPGTAGETGATNRFDRWLNTVPNQGSEAVRTEEAVFATLACLTLTE